LNTERLYYQDAYIREFDAQILARQVVNGRQAVALDRTAFYATGGGQPNDLGTVSTPADGPIRVLDVLAEDGAIWHVLDGELQGEDVHGTIDWDRRFDHMQQHTGQHVLSQAFFGECGAETVAFHLGERYSTIDLNRIDLDLAAVLRAESAANAIIDAALPVTATFVTPAELAQLPLRKPPKVTENIRVVQVMGFDWSACGGTHVANTSQIGLIKVIGTERRGTELRVTFLCGRRARADYARLKALAQSLVARYTAAEDEIPELLDRRAAELDALHKDLVDLERQWSASTAEALWSGAEIRGGVHVVTAALDVGVDRAKKLAQDLRSRPRVVACVGVRGDRPQIIVTRSDDVTVDSSQLLRMAVAVSGGRGGGRPDWAQGGVPTNEALDAALSAVVQAF